MSIDLHEGQKEGLKELTIMHHNNYMLQSNINIMPSSTGRRGHVHAGTGVAPDEALQDEPRIELHAEYAAGIAETADRGMKNSTRKGHCCRIKQMVNWCVAEYPAYALVATHG